jgi:hypothetical protein
MSSQNDIKNQKTESRARHYRRHGSSYSLYTCSSPEPKLILTRLLTSNDKCDARLRNGENQCQAAPYFKAKRQSVPSRYWIDGMPLSHHQTTKKHTKLFTILRCDTQLSRSIAFRYPAIPNCKKKKHCISISTILRYPTAKEATAF